MLIINPILYYINMTFHIIVCQQLAGFLVLFYSFLFYAFILSFIGLSCCHGLSPSLSAALVVSIIHHLHSQAIYTSFYSQSVFPLCWLHLSTLIQIFQPVYAVLGCLWVPGLKQHHYRYPCAVEKHMHTLTSMHKVLIHPATSKKKKGYTFLYENCISLPPLMALIKTVNPLVDFTEKQLRMLILLIK